MGTLGAWALIPSAIFYEPKINSRTVHGEKTGDIVQQEGGTAKGIADIVIDTQGGGGNGRTANRAAVLARMPGQVEAPEDSRLCVSAHGF